MKVALAGLGTVGAATLAALLKQAEKLSLSAGGETIELTAVCARDKGRDRGLSLEGLRWYDDPLEMARSPSVDLFVELIGGDQNSVAGRSIFAALESGKSVVTANKDLVSQCGDTLADLAESRGAFLGFEAAVLASIPVVETLRRRLPTKTISTVYGVMNGTCNFILTAMQERGLDFDVVLREAQERGYAEADPSFDVDGPDTAHKVAILSALAFGTKLDRDSVVTHGIRDLTLADVRRADELGYCLKLVGVARRTEDGIEQYVRPSMLPKSSPLAQVSGVLNAVGFIDEQAGPCLMTGAGAGAEATASAVLADIVEAARIKGAPRTAFDLPSKARSPFVRSSQGATHAYHLHLLLDDKVGAFARLAQVMAHNGISLSSILQRSPETKDPEHQRRVMIVTHDTRHEDIRAALSQIEKENLTSEKIRFFPIENL